ncbi:hypothetical protein HYW54_00130 [Candidatus Gottesmanbacteria bacterium]|nr:hypothetical protein [Candidatus Gottesmanbacteria bacterium]
MSYLLQNLEIRSKLIYYIREFFHSRNFKEVETPVLVDSLIPESYLEYFKTQLIDRKGNTKTMYLTASPESSIKKLLALGIGNCFEITRSFRNTETDSYLHNPEFTILEWYRINATYNDIMQDCEDLFVYLLNKLNLPNLLTYQGLRVDLTPPWKRLSMVEAFLKYAHLDLEKALSLDVMKSESLKRGYLQNSKTTWEELFNQIFLNEVETDDPRFAQRFEFYIAGLELGNCFTELIDPIEQKKRFEKEQKLRKQKKKMKILKDKQFLEALAAGLPPCSGIAVGLDRLTMLFTNSPRIQDVLPFAYQSK